MSRTLEMTIARSADDCYAAFCAAERLPEWVPHISRAEPVWRLPSGRPGEVSFTHDFEGGGSETYSLLYSYDSDHRKVGWHPAEDSDYAVRGFAAFEDDGAGCKMKYSLDLERHHAPAAAEMLEQAEETLEHFRRWMESGGDRQSTT